MWIRLSLSSTFNLHFQESSILTNCKTLSRFGIFKAFNLHFQESSILTMLMLKGLSHGYLNFQSPFSGVFNSNLLVNPFIDLDWTAFNLHFQESSILTKNKGIYNKERPRLSISIFRSLQF